jgi:hypothetical protein
VILLPVEAAGPPAAAAVLAGPTAMGRRANTKTLPEVGAYQWRVLPAEPLHAPRKAPGVMPRPSAALWFPSPGLLHSVALLMARPYQLHLLRQPQERRQPL